MVYLLFFDRLHKGTVIDLLDLRFIKVRPRHFIKEQDRTDDQDVIENHRPFRFFHLLHNSPFSTRMPLDSRFDKSSAHDPSLWHDELPDMDIDFFHRHPRHKLDSGAHLFLFFTKQ